MTEASFAQSFALMGRPKNRRSPAPLGQRIDWVDYAKGLGIFLVVVGHGLGGLINAGILPAHSGFSFAVDYIYSFHMPLFFFLSGLFIRPSARRRFRSYLGNKAGVIVYPYFLWSLLGGTVQHFASQSNNPISWLDIAKMFYVPIDQYWYLYVIFCMYLLFWMAYRLSMGNLTILALTIMLYIGEVSGANITRWDVLHSLGAFLIYAGLGSVIAESALPAALSRTTRDSLLMIAIAGYGLIGAIAMMDELKQPILHPIAAIAGIFATMALAILLDRLKVFSAIAAWGRYSLEIFVAHTIFAAGFRIIVQKSLGYDSPWVHIVVGTAIGIYLPILLAVICARIGFPYLFTAGRAPRQPEQRAAAAAAAQ